MDVNRISQFTVKVTNSVFERPKCPICVLVIMDMESADVYLGSHSVLEAQAVIIYPLMPCLTQRGPSSVLCSAVAGLSLITLFGVLLTT